MSICLQFAGDERPNLSNLKSIKFSILYWHTIQNHFFIILSHHHASLRRTFSRRNSRKKKRPSNKMAAREASVYPVRNRLSYHFFLYQTNESCSRIVSRRVMLLRSLNKSYFRVTAPNATEAERPFNERSHIVLHVIQRLAS